MDHISVTSDSRGVYTVTLNRPHTLNAFDEAMIAEIHNSFVTLDVDPTVRLVVLAASGKLFCAGADIKWMERQSVKDQAANLLDARCFAEMLRAIRECSKPTVVRVHGHSFGGGVGLMAASDIVVAARSTHFAVSEARFGILPSVIGPYLIEVMGVKQAQRLAMTTATFEADEACRLGLVHEVVNPEELDQAVARQVGMLLASSPASLDEIKKLYTKLHALQLTQDLRELTAQTLARVRDTDQAHEGFAAFLAKRPAKWVRT